MKKVFNTFKRVTGFTIELVRRGRNPQRLADLIYPIIKSNLEPILKRTLVNHVAPAIVPVASKTVQSSFGSNALFGIINNLTPITIKAWVANSVKSLEGNLTETLKEKIERDIVPTITPTISASLTRATIAYFYGKEKVKTISVEEWS